MNKYLLTPAARRDLSSIWDFTESRLGKAQAEKYIRGIQTEVQRISEEPSRGRRREDIRAGYRSWSVGSHVIFYMQRAENVIVVRILHQRMDFGQHL